MRVLYALHPKAKPLNWQRSGDTNMATRMISEFPKDIKIDVISDLSNMSPEDLEEIRERYGIDHLIDTSPYIQERHYLKSSMEFIRSIADQYDVIHFHNATVASIHWMRELFSDLNTPLIYTMHTPPDVGASFQWYHGDEYKAFARVPTNALVAVSPSHYQRVLNALKETPESMPSLMYITNGIETHKFESPETDHIADIAVIGRLDASKDIQHSLRAARVATDGPIIYIGDNWEGSTSTQNEDYYNDTVRFIQENGIIWKKSLPNEMVRKILAASKVHISLSRIETFGLTVAESMMQGTPVIGFNEGGIGDIILDGVTGRILPVDRKRWTSRYQDVKALYESCLTLDRNKVRDSTLKRFSIQRTVNEYTELYTNLLQKQGS